MNCWWVLLITFQIFFVFKFCLTKQKCHLFTCEDLELIVVISNVGLDYWPDFKNYGCLLF